MRLPFEPSFEDVDPRDVSGKVRRINATAALEHLRTESQAIEAVPASSVVVPPPIRSLARALGVTAPALYGNTGFGRGYGDMLQRLTGLMPVETSGIVLVGEGAHVTDYLEASTEATLPSLDGLSPDQLLAVIDDATARLGVPSIPPQ